MIYGLVHPLDTWNPLWGQFHHLIYIIRNIGVMRGIKNKLLFLVNGPGWFPGKPRLGDAKDIPEVRKSRFIAYTPPYCCFTGISRCKAIRLYGTILVNYILLTSFLVDNIFDTHTGKSIKCFAIFYVTGINPVFLLRFD